MTTTVQDIRQTPEQLTALAAELERVERTKKDYIVPASKFSALYDSGHEGIDLAIVTPVSDFPLRLGVTKVAHEQLADKLGIPLVYYRRMLAEQRGLLVTNINTWLRQDGRNHLLRVLDGNVRAVLGDTYRLIDNFDAFYSSIPVLQEAGATILRADVTEEHMFIRAIHPEFRERIEAQRERMVEDSPGHRVEPEMIEQRLPGERYNWNPDVGPDLVVPGIVIRNSEVGRGGFSVAPYVFRLRCSNGLFTDSELFQVHRGGRQGEGEYMSDETKQADDKAFWLKVRDLVRATMDAERFRKLVASMNNAASTPLTDAVEAVDVVVKNYALTDNDRQGILNSLIAGGDTSLWGLLNAVTFQAHDAEAKGDVEGSMNYQRIGGELLSDKGRELVVVRR